MKVPQVTTAHVTRQELYELVWASPISKLAEKFGMSDRGIAKICAKAEVPVPERGYWARVQAGQTAEKSPLPVPTATTPERVTIRPPTPRLLHRVLSLAVQAEPLEERPLVAAPQGLPLHQTDGQHTHEIEQKKETILFDRLVQQSRDHRTACEIRAFVSQVSASERAKVQPAGFTAWRDWALKQADRLDPTGNEHLFDRLVSDTELWSRGNS